MPDEIEPMTEEEDEAFAGYQAKARKERELRREVLRARADESITLTREEDEAFAQFEEQERKDMRYMDTLRLIVSGKELTIENCSAKIKFFCTNDAFPKYDAKGRLNEHEPDIFQSELLHAMNAAMLARSRCMAWEPLLDKPLPILSAIPADIDLVECSDADYLEVRKALKEYYLTISKEKWLTDMAASKMLYLKRPMLTAISDSYVREALGIPEPDAKEYPWKSQYCAERALRVSDAVRAVGLSNLPLLERLQIEMAPVVISKVRVLDILIWVDKAICAGHKMWRQASHEKGWITPTLC